MKILILGASGYIGTHIMLRLSQNYDKVYGTYHLEQAEYQGDTHMLHFEMGDWARLDEILNTVNPTYVVSCLTGDYELQMETHRRVAEFLAKREVKCMVYLSSVAVFDGATDKPHTESDEPAAETEYGKFKLQCEREMQKLLGDDCIILRIPLVYGRKCPRVLKLMQDTKLGETIQTYENLYVNYATAEQITGWLVYILKNGLKGIFHVGTEDMSEYSEFLERIIAALRLQVPIYQTEYYAENRYQAAIPGRSEIPAKLRLTVEQVLRSVWENER